MKTYKNPITADGRLKVHPSVTPGKLKAVKELMDAHLSGNKVATAKLEEALTTSDAIFSLAHLTTMNFLPQYDEAPRVWTQIAGTAQVSDFKPAIWYDLVWDNTDGHGKSNVLGVHGEAPVIPEGSNYPYVYVTALSDQSGKVTKKGFKTDWTLESRINDGMGVIDQLPRMMQEAALDTEESEVMTPLMAAGIALAGGSVPTGATIPANAPLSRDALIRAQIELSERTVNGRKVMVNGGYNLLVAPGQGMYANFILNQTLVGFDKSSDPKWSYVIGNGYNPLANITPIETDWISGAAWKLLPKPGATRRPTVNRLELRGYQTPQLFVENLTGNYVGGGQASPFEGSFANDSITLKLRQFGGGLVYDGGVNIVNSSGAGS